MHTAKERVDTMISIVDEISKTYGYNCQLISQKDKETQDLLHEIELIKFDYKKGNKLVRELQKVRKARRQAADENRTLKPLFDYFNDKTILKDLRKIQQEIVRDSQKMEARTYTPKVRNDLTCTELEPTSSMKEAFERAK